MPPPESEGRHANRGAPKGSSAPPPLRVSTTPRASRVHDPCVPHLSGATRASSRMRDGVRRVACERWGTQGSCTRDARAGSCSHPLPCRGDAGREQRVPPPSCDRFPTNASRVTGAAGTRLGHACPHPARPPLCASRGAQEGQRPPPSSTRASASVRAAPPAPRVCARASPSTQAAPPPTTTSPLRPLPFAPEPSRDAGGAGAPPLPACPRPPAAPPPPAQGAWEWRTCERGRWVKWRGARAAWGDAPKRKGAGRETATAMAHPCVCAVGEGACGGRAEWMRSCCPPALDLEKQFRSLCKLY